MVSSAILVAQANSPHVPDGASIDCGYDRPLALMPVLNRPLIMHAVADLAALGVERVVVVVDRRIAGPLASTVSGAAPDSISVELLECSRSVPLLTAIARARQRLADGAFALQFAEYLSRGDIRSQLDPGWELGDTDAVALMSRFSDRAAISSAKPEASVEEGELTEEGEPVGSNGSRSAAGEHFAGVFLVGANFPTTLEGVEGRRSMKAIAAALEQLEAAGGRVVRRYVTDWWRYRGQPEPMLEMNRFMLARLPEQACEGGLVDSDVQGAVECHPTARIERSLIRGPAVIGPEAEIRDAFVGPHTSVGADVRIEGAEVENSVILDGSSIANLGDRLDSSVIGPRARISRDFRMPRGARMSVGPGASISLF
jgi:glucose-1-phosphate thymidylyltransferase